MQEERPKESMDKFDNLWMGPFQIIAVQDNNTYELAHIDGDVLGALSMGGFSSIFAILSSKCILLVQY
jgi:hypothetical protein